MFRSSYRRFSGIAITALVGLLLLSVIVVPRAVTATPTDPVTTAWHAARAAGSYHFTSDVTQVTLPVATLTNVGRSSRTQKFYLEGQNDLHAEKLELTLWSDAGSTLQAESGLSIRSERGETFARHGSGEWQPIDDVIGSLAPQGDFMSYLAAIKDVQAQPTEMRNGIRFTRHTFQIDSPRFALHIHKEMEATLRARGELPPGMLLNVPTYLRDMVGTGELWVGEAGLPLRQMLTLLFPAQNDEQVNLQIVVNFTEFGHAGASLAAQGSGDHDPRFITPLAAMMKQLAPTLFTFSLLVLAALLFYFRRARRLQMAVVVLVIFALVVGPLLTTYTHVKFFDVQTAKAAAQEERQAAAQAERDLREALGTVEFNPHLNPLESERSRDWGASSTHSLQSPTLSISQSPNAQSTDTGLDTDGDGLTDFVEARVGTDPNFADSDEDGVSDQLEVMGFTLPNDPAQRRWYANPLEADSNNDGLPDGLEWDNNGDGIPDDTDGDGIPDLFDPDNDNDGVPDSKDSAPFAVITRPGGFDEANPFQLKLQNLAAGKPTFVDFQIRPQAANHLWFAFNVLDWPQDSQGQMRDIDGKTYADLTPAGGAPAANNTQGDMKLVPMLEVRMPKDSANLPPAGDLIPYNITVNNYTADGATKIAYVPLSILTDEQTGQRVAFTARMRYLPTGAWLQAHEVRLVWLVQALVDLPCDPQAADAEPGCAADGYIHNVPQVIRSYYDAFSLTGLNVREDHGAGTAIIYEDPRVDSNLKDDAALVALSHGLDNSFLAPRDQNNDGQRDVTLAEIARRFDRDTNSAVSATERWGIANTLQVERQEYATGDGAVVSLAMTETTRILNSAFQSYWNADKTLQPLLMFAQEETYRALGLDGTRAGGNYITFSGTTLTVDMAPGGQPPVASDTLASLKWMPYCAPDGATPRWAPCDLDRYWTELEGRYGLNTSLPEYPNNPDVIAGNMAVLQLYFLSLINGHTRAVLRNNGLVSSLYTLKSDSEMETLIRTATGAGGSLVKGLTNTVVMARYVDKVSVLTYLGRQFREFRGSDFANWVRDVPASILSEFRTGGTINRLGGTAIVLGVGVVLAGVATAAYFLVDSFLSSDPARNLGAQITIKVLVIGITTFLSVISPLKAALEWVKLVKAVGGSAGSVLSGSSQVLGSTRTASVVGTVIAAGITWGFFIYSMVANNVTAFSPTFNRALAETIASTVYLILLFVLSLTVIGTILVGIVAVIDAILTAICELGVDELRTVPGLGGACFTLGTAAVKVLAYSIYNYDLMINTDRNDLMVTGSPQVTLADTGLGYAAGNTLAVALPVTTTVVHKDPDPANGLLIYPYLWLYSQDSLKSSTFKYSLDRTADITPTVALNDMKDSWQNVSEDHKFVLTPMYRGTASMMTAPLGGYVLTAGLNRPVQFTLNMGFAVPAYECWGLLAVGVCYRREYQGGNHLPINALFYDVFPATLDGFMSLTSSGDGGLRLGWDAAFPTLRDADGDGLLSAAYNGLDPNDASVDADNDGLTDRYELERRQAGVAYSPISCDTDGDGLTDLQEMQLGTNPAVADSDNDGLMDGEEVWHQVYDTSTCQPTGNWAGGWEVMINTSPPFIVRVSSNPLRADSDGDGVNDLAERQLAQGAPEARVDNQNRPYHPLVPNTPPLAVFVATDDADGFLKPDQSFRYTTTVVANVSVAPGVLTINKPDALGGALNPLALPFNPLTFNTAQTVTQAINVTTSGLTGQVGITSTASTRLKDTGPGGWAFDFPVPVEAPLGGIVSPAVANFSAVTASRPDRQDNYLLSALVIKVPAYPLGSGGRGDILAYSIPGGAMRAIENDANDTAALLHQTSPSMATNANGDTLAVWGQTAISAPNIDSGHIIAGALLGSDGQIKRSITFPTSPVPTSYTRYSYGPVVASNGNGFLVAYESFARSSTEVPGRIQIVLQVFDKDGNPLNQTYFDAGSPQTGDALTRDSLALDVAWIGNPYRVVWQDRRDATVWATVTASPSIATPLVVANNALTNAGASYGPSLAYDPISGRTLVVYLDATKKVVGKIYQGTTQVGALDPAMQFLDNAASPKVVWHPGYHGWLLSYQDASDRSLTRLRAVTANGVEAFPRSYTLSTNAKNDNSLACPAPQSYPAVDLRFDDLPGTTVFADASGYSNNATCTGTSCPAAGHPGAPNAPRSDYAVRFDGVNDRLTINTAFPYDFTAAYWVKATPNANNSVIVLDHGANAPGGWTLSFDAGRPAFLVNTNYLVSPTRIDDNGWHFVVGTRDQKGAIALYVDGNQVASSTGTATLLDAFTNLLIGGDRSGNRNLNGDIDHLQLWPTALAGDAIQAIYNRTNQSYCVAAGTSGSNVYWSKVQASQPDVRGGRISASNRLALTIDSDLPSAQITSVQPGDVVAAGLVIGGTAADATSGVGLVEVSVNNGPWLAAAGSNTWSFSLAGYSGNLSLRIRATDNVGNVGNASAPVALTIDNAAPVVTIDPPSAPTIKPTQAANGQWQVALAGSLNDQPAGVKPGSVRVTLVQQSGIGVAQSEQVATTSATGWNLTYLLDPSLTDPTGAYTVTVTAEDNVGQRAAPVTRLIRLDATGPVAALDAIHTTRQVISNTLFLSGVVTDANSIVGVEQVEIAYTPIEQVLRLPPGIVGSAAEPLLNRPWQPVTRFFADTSSWSVRLPDNLEGVYQIDLRATDKLGNVSITSNVWRGTIDVRSPRLLMTGTVTGNSVFDAPTNTRYYEINYLCRAEDWKLNESSFNCPNPYANRTFNNDPLLQSTFPSVTLAIVMSSTWTIWSPFAVPSGSLSACDSVGLCASVPVRSIPSVAATGETAAAAALVEAAASADEALKAVVFHPTNDSFVGSTGTVDVSIAVEAPQSVRDVTVYLDGVVAATIPFSSTDALTFAQRTLLLPMSAGKHTLEVRASDWAGNVQSNPSATTFTVLAGQPTITLGKDRLTMDDTWAAQSGILVLRGTVDDSHNALAAVQVKVAGDHWTQPYLDAQFDNGVWGVAYPAIDPEHTTLTVTVRAIDKAGQITMLNRNVASELGGDQLPETTLTATPPASSISTSAVFTFTGDAAAATFECQLNEGVYTHCVSPTGYSHLSKGEHTFRVRAINSLGHVDPTPASFTWIVNTSDGVDVTITDKPANPSIERTATFAFIGTGAVGFECALDGGHFTPCASPHSYHGLADGNHTFQVRGKDSAGSMGAAHHYRWRINNAAPVAVDGAATTVENSTVPISLNANDNDPLTYQIVKRPEHGVLFGVPPDLLYKPDSRYVGLDSFTFRANDGQAESNVATVTITVEADTTDNTPPVITPQVSGTAGSNGWYVSDVSLTWSVVDGESPVTNTTGCEPASVTTDTPGQTFTCSATSRGGTASESVTLKLDKSAPETTITSAPASVVYVTEASYSFTGSDANGVSFQCSLNGAAFTPCTSPLNLTNLLPGAQTFAVRAVDAAGNVDATPASHSFTVEANVVIATCFGYTVRQVAGGAYVAAGWAGRILVGTAGNDTLTGTSGPELILGLGGNDKLDGKGGDDVICGGEGNDTLIGGPGNDYLDGGPGNDKLVGGTGFHDVLVGGDGNDLISDPDGALVVSGGAGNDTISVVYKNGWTNPAGLRIVDSITGGYGNDKVNLALGGRQPYLLTISGDEWDNPPSPLEGLADRLSLVGPLDPASSLIKFEVQYVRPAEADTEIDEAALLAEWSAASEWLSEEAAEEESVDTHLFLPVVAVQ